jgi:hypothetical protein
LPFSIRNIAGYVGNCRFVFVYVHFLVFGSKISFFPGTNWPMSSSPERLRTLPSDRVVSVGYQRASFIGSTLMYFSATGSNS